MPKTAFDITEDGITPIVTKLYTKEASSFPIVAPDFADKPHDIYLLTLYARDPFSPSDNGEWRFIATDSQLRYIAETIMRVVNGETE